MGRLDLPDKVRDEDRDYEIGSDFWIAREIAAGRSGEERDRPDAVLTDQASYLHR